MPLAGGMALPKALSDTVDPRAFAGGRFKVDLPFGRWIIRNRDRFVRRMPLSAFLKLFPAWLLKDAYESASEAGEHASDRELVVRSAALALALEHLALWVDSPGSAVELSAERLASCVDALRAACALEFQRRCGLFRVHVEGEDRLDLEPRMSVEINPLVVELLKESGEAIAPGSREFEAVMARALPAALNSDWADRDGLANDAEA